MPELPEVETIIRELRSSKLIGLKIKKASVFWERTLLEQNSSSFCRAICGQAFKDIFRRGKYLVFVLTDFTLFVHLRMTGKFFIDAKETPPHSHERIRLYLSNGRILRYEDQRKFGKWLLTSQPEKVFSKLGLEPLSSDFTLEKFQKLLAGKKGRIKPFLLDQRVISGIGNIYADEALWLASIHPLRAVDSLNKAEISLLHQAIISSLQKGIENTGTSLGSARANYFSVSGRRGENKTEVFRREGLPCPRCGATIEKIVVAQRGTHLCPKCQR